MAFHIPLFRPGLKSRRSFDRLRSLHLLSNHGGAIPASPAALIPADATSRRTISKVVKRSLSMVPRSLPRSLPPLYATNGIIPVPPIFYFGLAILCSVIFVLTIPSVFHGVTMEVSPFKAILNKVAQENPGIVLLGEDLDIDIDEPSVSIRWSIVACGTDFVLNGSSGIHGSSLCGLPNIPLNIYVDGNLDPDGTYNPELIPYNTGGERRSIQNLVQFDSDHVLDVHTARLYPFDTYFLSSTLRVTTGTQNTSISISKLATINITSSFIAETEDIASYGSNAAGVATPSCDIDMHIRRPTEARAITLLLFASSWFLTHICFGSVILARRTKDIQTILKFLILNFATVIGLPQLRNSMPDAPGLDGVLLDTIGFFPQMVIAVLCVVFLVLIVISRELKRSEMEGYGVPQLPQHTPRQSSTRFSTTRFSTPSKKRPPPLPLPTSSSSDIARYNIYRISKHLKGEFVFPPVRAEDLRPIQEENGVESPTHRRLKTIVGSPGRL